MARRTPKPSSDKRKQPKRRLQKQRKTDTVTDRLIRRAGKNQTRTIKDRVRGSRTGSRYQTFRLGRKKNNRNQPLQKQRQRITLPTMAELVQSIALSARLLSFVGLAMCFLCLMLLNGNQRFHVEQYNVDGLNNSTTDHVMSWIAPYSGHLFSLNPDEMARTFRAIPGMKQADVQIIWPDIVSMTVEEQDPLFVWEEHGRQYWISAEGDIVPLANPLPQLPTIIADVPYNEPITVEQLILENPELSAEEIASLPKPSPTYWASIPLDIVAGVQVLHELLPETKQFEYDLRHGLMIQTSYGWPVYLGQGADMERKIYTYYQVQDVVVNKGQLVEYIDVSAKNVFYKPVEGAGIPLGEQDE